MSNKMALDALKFAEAALADIGDADREPGDDLAWCETRAAEALPKTRAAIAALQAEPQGWMPIETAPKDGTRILLSNGATVAEGEWLHAESYVKEIRDMDGRYVDQEEFDGHDDWIDYTGGMLPPPTCWMPLPATPPKD